MRFPFDPAASAINASGLVVRTLRESKCMARANFGIAENCYFYEVFRKRRAAYPVASPAKITALRALKGKKKGFLYPYSLGLRLQTPVS